MQYYVNGKPLTIFCKSIIPLKQLFIQISCPLLIHALDVMMMMMIGKSFKYQISQENEPFFPVHHKIMSSFPNGCKQ